MSLRTKLFAEERNTSSIPLKVDIEYISRVYKYLSYYEPNKECRMNWHKIRIRVLEECLKMLNVKS